jgi:nucleoside-diphosphate-sugar epimerase
VTVNLFDSEALAIATAGHDVIAHFATAIPPYADMGKRQAWAMNDRLRSEAVHKLLAAASTNGIGRFIQESITFIYADGGEAWLDEESRVAPTADILESVMVAERATTDFTESWGSGVILRISRLYGPVASADYLQRVAAGKLPVAGTASNYVSQLHTDDAGSAVVASLSLPAGIYNVSDDDPVTARDDLDALVAALGARRPRSVPKWLARAVAGDVVSVTTASHRVSNGKFKRATGWVPSHSSVRTGWPAVVTAMRSAEAKTASDSARWRR